MRKLLLTLTALVAFASMSFAQNRPSKNRVDSKATNKVTQRHQLTDKQTQQIAHPVTLKSQLPEILKKKNSSSTSARKPQRKN